MISKSLFCKLMKEDVKQRLWSVIVAAILFLSIPVSMAMCLENDSGYRDRDIFLRQVGKLVTNSEVLVLFTCACSVVLGLSGFWYLFSKKKVDFYHALPVKREVLFFVRYINGVLIYAVPYVLAVLISLVIAAIGDAFPVNIIRDSLAWFGFHLCAYLLLYTVTVLAVMLTGNLVISMGAVVVLFVYAIVVDLLEAGYGEFFFDTYCYSSSLFEGRLGFLKWVSPVYLYASFFDDHMLGMGSLKMLLLALILVAVALTLYKMRAMENAGLALAFAKIKAPVRILLVIPCGLAMGLFLCAISEHQSVLWLLFGILCGVVFAHGLLESIYEYDIRKALSHKVQLAVCFAVTVFIAFSYRQDWFDFNGYLPNKEKVERIGLSISGINYGNMYWNQKGNAEELDVLYDIAEFCVRDTYKEEGDLSYYDLSYYNGEYTKNPTTNEKFYSVKVSYCLKGGSTTSRRYMVNLCSDASLWDDLYAKTDFASARFADMLSLEAADLELVQTVKEERYKEYTLSEAEKQELLDALSHDIRKLRYRTLREEFPLAELRIEAKNYNYSYIQLYSCYTETLAFLEAHGFKTEEHIPLEQVRSLTLYDYRAEYGRETTVIFETSQSYGDMEIAQTTQMGHDYVIMDLELLEQIYPYLVWDDCTNLFSNVLDNVDCVLLLDLDEYGNYLHIPYSIRSDAPVDEWIAAAQKQENME